MWKNLIQRDLETFEKCLESTNGINFSMTNLETLYIYLNLILHQ